MAEEKLRMCVTLESVNEFINRVEDICMDAAEINTPQAYSDGMDRIMEILADEQIMVVQAMARYRDDQKILEEFRARKKETVYKE